MSGKIEFEVTAAVVAAMAECYDPTWGYPDASIGKEWAEKSLKAALAHPSFQSQLRAYVAGEARRLVERQQRYWSIDGLMGATAGGNWIQRDETLANIAAYEKKAALENPNE